MVNLLTLQVMVQDMYSEVSETALKSAMSEMDVMNSGYFALGELGLTEDINLDAINTAYATVIAESKAEIAAQANDEESEWYQCSADGSFVFSCTEVEGAYVLNIKIAMTMITPEETIVGAQEIVLTVKDGEIIYKM